ncbi:MAG TPA: TonB-dependent receptor, partial [Candidatus Polarisedimenticolia bacterium]|nr:TonB-dependent receptor [Candidatus Polarisedimenticolia bacterium]
MTWHARSILIRTQSCALLLVSLTADPVFSQTAPSTLQGRVIDEQGAGLPGVLLSLTSGSAESTERSLVTDADGRYHFEGVAPGAGYRLRASIPSYATVIAEGIELPSGGTVRLDLSLRPSSDLEETIRVEARGEIVDTASGVTATVYNAEFIAGLPLLGREFSDLLTLAPGVTDSDGDGNVNVRGARDTGLQVRMDGTNTTNPLTGHQGQDVNLEIIDELEIITAGAPAEFGRADGGFANIITKSGSNEREGSFKLFYRTDFLDGDGANTRREPVPSFNDSRAFLTFSGPFVRDHLWYFASAERLDREQPTIFLDGTSALVTQEGWRAFGKTTWQADTANKLALQVNYDPLELGGNNIGQGVAAETDYLIRAGGSLPQLTWTSIMSPTLLLQVTASHLNAHQEIDPVSSEFRVIEGLDPIVLSDGTRSVPLPCVIRNCRGEPGLHRFFRLGSTALRAQREIQQEAGPYSTRSRQELARSTIRADLSYTIEERLGQHAIKSGFEFNLEEYAEDRIGNPILTDRTCEFAVCGFRTQTPPPAEERQGELLLEVFQPVRKPLTAEGLAAGVYLQDAWKPRPNLTINAGLRFDHEEIDTVGFTAFDPLPEAREALRRYDLVCEAAGTICTSSRDAGRRNGTLPTVVTPPPGHPALEFDLNGNGDLELQGPEGRLISVDPFTTRAERLPATFFISNSNLAPRLSVSWDPWSDGKTKLFGTLGRYYDRLFLGTVTTGQDPESFTARWFLRFFGPQAEPGALSSPITDGVNISQTDRGLTTPYTDEWSVGVERELAPEWSVSLALIRRRGH